MKTEFREV
jgi:hypothetical protein